MWVSVGELDFECVETRRRPFDLEALLFFILVGVRCTDSDGAWVAFCSFLAKDETRLVKVFIYRCVWPV